MNKSWFGTVIALAVEAGSNPEKIQVEEQGKWGWHKILILKENKQEKQTATLTSRTSFDELTAPLQHWTVGAKHFPILCFFKVSRIISN